MKKNLYLLIVSLFVNISHKSYGQKQFSYIDGYAINSSVGFANVMGELGDFLTLSPVLSLGLEKGISEKLNLQLDFNIGKLAGYDDKVYSSRFESDFFQVNLLSELNMSRLFDDSQRNSMFRPYLGLGLIWFHTDVYDLSKGIFLRTTADGTTRHTAFFQQSGSGIGDKGIYYTRELVVPFGFLTEFWLSKRLSIITDLRYNWVYNDKLDATTPYNLTISHKIGGTNSYSNTANDSWMRLSVGLKYKFVSLRIMKQRGI